jgi:hypothetical protein
MLRIALALLGLILVAFVGGQIVLPRVAERRIAGDLRATGEVEYVSVRAFPAVKLLWSRADRVEVRMSEARAATGRLAKLLAKTRGTSELDARIARVQVGPLRLRGLRGLRLRKDGGRLGAEASVDTADLAAALPPQLAIRPLVADDGQLVLEATAGLFGLRAAFRARLSAREGALVIAPDGVLGGLGELTVFRDPRVQVTGVGSRPRAEGFTLLANARLAGS